MKKLLMAGAIGAGVTYYLDGQRGRARRQHLVSVWRESRDATLAAGHHAARAVEPITPVPEQLLARIDPRGRGNRTAAVARPVSALVLGGLVTGAMFYLLDPTLGRERRARIRNAWDRATRRAERPESMAPGEHPAGAEPGPNHKTPKSAETRGDAIPALT